MKIMYIYDYYGAPKYRRNIGCIVVDGSHIGISICNSKDNFSKKMARAIATGRMQKGSNFDVNHLPNRQIVDYSGNLVNLRDYVSSAITYLTSRTPQSIN